MYSGNEKVAELLIYNGSYFTEHSEKKPILLTAVECGNVAIPTALLHKNYENFQLVLKQIFDFR